MMCANTENCKDQTRCVAQLCFGKFLHTMIAGWDDSECQRAFDAICQHTFILKNMKIVVSSKPGDTFNTKVATLIVEHRSFYPTNRRMF